MTVEQLAAHILEQTQARLKRLYPTSPQWEWERVQVKVGPKYTKIDRGPEHNMSGMLMIENATGRIYGIKGYGKVHKGHYYGTLDTVADYDWSNYYPEKITEVISKSVKIGEGSGWLVRHRGHPYVISEGHDGQVQVFRWNAIKRYVTDWDDVAGGHGYTRETALADLVARPHDEAGRAMSARDVLDAAEAEADLAAEDAADRRDWNCEITEPHLSHDGCSGGGRHIKPSPARQPVDPELFKRTAPAWNCVDYPGEGMHYFPGTTSCAWCGATREQANAELADLPTSGNAMLDQHERDADAALALHRNLIHGGELCGCARPGAVQVKRDGEVKAAFTSDDPVKNSNDAFAWLLKHQGMSTDWAIRYEGWEITDPVPSPGCCEQCEGNEQA